LTQVGGFLERRDADREADRVRGGVVAAVGAGTTKGALR
jgi:hypothetical protein